MFQHLPIVLTSPLKLGSISQVEGRLLVDPSHLVGKVAVNDEEGLAEVAAKVRRVLMLCTFVCFDVSVT